MNLLQNFLSTAKKRTIYIDSTKVFGMVDHYIFLNKLLQLDVDDKWIASYLHNWKTGGQSLGNESAIASCLLKFVERS